MKKSLRESIRLFSFFDQLLIISGLIYYKLKIKPHSIISSLLEKCNNYVRLIEQGVIFTKENKNLIKTSVVINNQSVTVFLRENTSDLQVFESVIQQEEYKIAVEQLRSVSSNNWPTIIDAGGNIGMTTIYLHAYFPFAKFYIIEPDEKNGLQLKRNLEENRIVDAEFFKNALWVNNEKLIISCSFRDGKDWSLSVEPANGKVEQTKNSFLKGITLADICASKGIERIDLLKIDIEGAERFLFNNDSFLQTVNMLVRNLVIEIHDEFYIRDDINDAMKNLGFSKVEIGSITLYSK